MNPILIHFSCAPFSGLSDKDGLDLALVLATFEYPVELFFSQSALALLHTGQQPNAFSGKQLYKLLDGLEFYDIESIYVLEEEWRQQGEPELWPKVHYLTTTEWRQKLPNYAHIIRF